MSYCGTTNWYGWNGYSKYYGYSKIKYSAYSQDDGSHSSGGKHEHDSADTHSHQNGKGHYSHGKGWGYGHHKSKKSKDKVDANKDYVTTDEDASAIVNVLANDESKMGLALEVNSFEGFDAGETAILTTKGGREVEVTIEADGTATVTLLSGADTLDAGQSDEVYIYYTATNGEGKTDKSKLVVTINGLDDVAPVISLVSDEVTVGELEDVTINVLSNDSNADAVTSVSFGGETFEVGESFSVTSADGRTGTVVVEADGTLTFTGDGNFEDLNDGESDTVTVSYTVGEEGTPARVIDFEGLGRGDVVSDQFEGVTISAQRYKDKSYSENDAMIFDSNKTTGGDKDLRTSSQDNILIISEDNHSHDPDDNGKGGSIFITFDEPETLESMTFIDTEDRPKLYLTLEDGSVEKIYGPETSNGGVAKDFAINVEGVVSVEIVLKSSGAIDDIALGAKAGGAQTAEVTITIDGEGVPLSIEDDAFALLENGALDANVLGNDVAEGDLVVSSFEGLAAGETAEVTSADGRTGFITVGEDGSISFTADGDFETLAVGDSDTITLSYSAATVGGPGENLIINGDFENNSLNNSGWGTFDSITGWTSPVGRIEIQESNYGTGNTQGNAVVELDSHGNPSNSTIQQVVEIADAGVYTLSVDYAARGTNFATNGFDIVVNGEVVSEVRPNERGFLNETVELELDAGDAVIQFRAQGTEDTIGTVIDNVSLVSNTTNEDVGDATVTITIDGVNDGPVAQDDFATANEDLGSNVPAITGNVLDNDSDVDDGDVLTVVAVSGIAGAGTVGQTFDVVSDVNGFAGTARINADGSVTVTPGDGFAALNDGESDTITIDYTIEDGNGGSSEAQVVVTVEGADGGIALTDDTLNVFENAGAQLDVLANDNGEGLTVTSVDGNNAGQPFLAQSAGGRNLQVILAANGTLTVVANEEFDPLSFGETDTIRLNYTAEDSTGATADAFIDVTVIGINDDIHVFMNEDEPIEVNQGGVGVGEAFILGPNGGPALVDVDGDAAQFSISTQGEFITATIDPNTGEFTFTGEFGFFGFDTFEFTVTDGLSFDTGSVTAQIINVGQAPVIDATASDLSVGASLIGGFLTASGILTAFDADDFDFTHGGADLPDDVLEIEVRGGVGIEATGAGDDELLAELLGEFVGGAFDLTELDENNVANFDFQLDGAELGELLLSEGFDATNLATASADLTFTIQINDQTARSTETELTISFDSDDLVGLLDGVGTGGGGGEGGGGGVFG